MAYLWTFWYLSGHNGVVVGTGCASEHKDMTVGIRACQWAQGHASGHKDVTVGIKTCQGAQGRAHGHKGVLVGIKT